MVVAAPEELEGADWRRRGWWRDGTVLDDLRRAVATRAEQPAIVCRYVDGSPAETLTWLELAARVDRAAGGLVELGVRPGDVLALQLPNGWPLAVLALAAARVGAAVGPLMPILRRREVAFALARTGSPVVVAPAQHRGFSHAGMLAEVADEVPTLLSRVLLDPTGPLPEGVVDFTEHFVRTPWEQRHPAAELDGLEAGADDLAQVMFTSGTTGEPKGVLHSHNTLYALTRAEADALHLTGEDVVTMGSPMTHQAGYAYCLLMPMLLGATAVYQDGWDPALMQRVIAEHRVTFSMGAPTFLVDLIEAQRRAPADLSSLRAFACGSAPIAPVVVERAAEVLGARVYALWGMTENGTVTITRPEDPPGRAAESDGSPVEWMAVRIVDDAGEPVPPGTGGRLQVRGASQCLGYFGRPDLYAESLVDGWFDTGDLARDDGHGGIRIVGRVKDVIARGGEKIPVVEVEAALLRHPSVRAAAVVGLPDERLGERACAVVAADGPLTLDDLREHLAGLGMAKQYWPERLELVPELPTTPSGKVQKFLLRERLAD
jgi:cyclohexanecarboxylate-CoA ligase